MIIIASPTNYTVDFVSFLSGVSLFSNMVLSAYCSTFASLMILLFFRTAAAILERRAGVNNEMINVGPVVMTVPLPIMSMYKIKSIRKCMYSITIHRGTKYKNSLFLLRNSWQSNLQLHVSLCSTLICGCSPRKFSWAFSSFWCLIFCLS